MLRSSLAHACFTVQESQAPPFTFSWFVQGSPKVLGTGDYANQLQDQQKVDSLFPAHLKLSLLISQFPI